MLKYCHCNKMNSNIYHCFFFLILKVKREQPFGVYIIFCLSCYFWGKIKYLFQFGKSKK